MNECEICHQEKPYALVELPGPGDFLACRSCAGRDEWERANDAGREQALKQLRERRRTS
jgi:hypothetical protein